MCAHRIRGWRGYWHSDAPPYFLNHSPDSRKVKLFDVVLSPHGVRDVPHHQVNCGRVGHAVGDGGERGAKPLHRPTGDVAPILADHVRVIPSLSGARVARAAERGAAVRCEQRVVWPGRSLSNDHVRADRGDRFGHQHAASRDAGLAAAERVRTGVEVDRADRDRRKIDGQEGAIQREQAGGVEHSIGRNGSHRLVELLLRIERRPFVERGPHLCLVGLSEIGSERHGRGIEPERMPAGARPIEKRGEVDDLASPCGRRLVGDGPHVSREPGRIHGGGGRIGADRGREPREHVGVVVVGATRELSRRPGAVSLPEMRKVHLGQPFDRCRAHDDRPTDFHDAASELDDACGQHLEHVVEGHGLRDVPLAAANRLVPAVGGRVEAVVGAKVLLALGERAKPVGKRHDWIVVEAYGGRQDQSPRRSRKTCDFAGHYGEIAMIAEMNHLRFSKPTVARSNRAGHIGVSKPRSLTNNADFSGDCAPGARVFRAVETAPNLSEHSPDCPPVVVEAVEGPLVAAGRPGAPSRAVGKTVDRTCEHCGSAFRVDKPSYPHRFCSLSCSSSRPKGDVMRIHHGDDDRAKRRAHSFIQGRIRIGMIVRPDACERCGSGGDIDAAHIDYSRPHVVAFICTACHIRSHHDPAIDAEVRQLAKPRGPEPRSKRYESTAPTEAA